MHYAVNEKSKSCFCLGTDKQKLSDLDNLTQNELASRLGKNFGHAQTETAVNLWWFLSDCYRDQGGYTIIDDFDYDAMHKYRDFRIVGSVHDDLRPGKTLKEISNV